MSYLLFISSPCQNRRITEYSLTEWQKIMLENYSLCQNRRTARRMFGNKKISVSANQICCFASTMKNKVNRNLTIACHRHPTE